MKARDQLFSIAYIANMIGRSFKKLPSFTASELAEELLVEFIKKWSGKDDSHVDEMDEFFESPEVQKRIKEVASQY